MTRVCKLILLLIVLLLALACKKQNIEQMPVEITWDRDICQECGMGISDHRYAAQIIDQNGVGFVFNDIGCAVNWLKEKPWKHQARIWVSDANTMRWIDAEKANWSFGNPNTPMGYGFTATLESMDNPMDFRTVQHRIENNQTLRHHHSQQHLGGGHQVPKNESHHEQLPKWTSMTAK